MKKKIIIWGTGGKGTQLNRMISSGKIPELLDCEVVAFCDNYGVSGMCYMKRPIIRPKQLMNYSDISIVISSETILDDVMKQLMALGILKEVFYCPDYTYRFKWNEDMPLFIPVDNNKPRLPYLEISVFAKCNLNCRGCSAASNIVDSWYMTKEYLEKQYIALKGKFSGIKYLKLFGGEPLLNPELADLVEVSRKYWPDAEIVVHSNGVLVPEMEERVLEQMNKYDVSFVFTLYPETGRKQRYIEKRLGQAGVDFFFRKPVYQFYKVINSKGSYDPDEVFRTCGKCINLHDGKLSCGLDYLLDVIEKEYDISICDKKYDHTINVYETKLDGWEINRILDSPFELCKYCAFMRYNDLDESQAFDWEPFSTARLEDWIIDEENL